MAPSTLGITGRKSLGSSSSRSRKKTQEKIVGAWSEAEHSAFLRALEKVPESEKTRWKLIAEMIPTRNPTQVRTHATKYFRTLARRDKLALQGGGVGSHNMSRTLLLESSSAAKKLQTTLKAPPPLSLGLMSSSAIGKKRPSSAMTPPAVSPTSIASATLLGGGRGAGTEVSSSGLSLSGAEDGKGADLMMDSLFIKHFDSLAERGDEYSFLSPIEFSQGQYKRLRTLMMGDACHSPSSSALPLPEDEAFLFNSMSYFTEEDECLDWLLDLFEEAPRGAKKLTSPSAQQSPEASSSTSLTSSATLMSSAVTASSQAPTTTALSKAVDRMAVTGTQQGFSAMPSLLQT